MTECTKCLGGQVTVGKKSVSIDICGRYKGQGLKDMKISPVSIFNGITQCLPDKMKMVNEFKGPEWILQ